MFKADRIIIVLYLVTIPMLLASNLFIQFYDESVSLFLISLAIIDSVLNQEWKRYSGLWILMCVLCFYVTYSIVYVHFNTTPYILKDALIESKPFVAFFVFFGIAPRLTALDKHWMKTIALITGIITISFMLIGQTKALFGHPAVSGAVVFISAMSYWFATTDDSGETSNHDKLVVFLLLCGGLLCTRSKYYGCFVLASFFLYFYRPGITRKFKFKHALILILLGIIFVGVAWKKFNYYFITGGSDTFDPNKISSYARAALILTSFLILWDYLPFGSGFASFGSYPSSENYSTLYYEYNLDKVYGLSPDMPDFIMDTYYSTMAQYGVAGWILFIYFWISAYRPLRTMVRHHKLIPLFSVGSLLICYLLIESVGGTSISQPSGQTAMMLLGIICGYGKHIGRYTAEHNESPEKSQKINSDNLNRKVI